MLGEKEKQKQEVSAPANDVHKQIDWLNFSYWNCDWTRAWQAVMSNELSQRSIYQNSKKQVLFIVNLLTTAVFEYCSKNVSNG